MIYITHFFAPISEKFSEMHYTKKCQIWQEKIKSKLFFITLKQKIDEDCLFVSTKPHFQTPAQYCTSQSNCLVELCHSFINWNTLVSSLNYKFLTWNGCGSYWLILWADTRWFALRTFSEIFFTLAFILHLFTLSGAKTQSVNISVRTLWIQEQQILFLSTSKRRLSIHMTGMHAFLHPWLFYLFIGELHADWLA